MSVTFERVYFILMALSGLVFVISMIRDIRRFRNGLYLLLFLLLLSFYILIYYAPTQYGSFVALIYSLLVVFLVVIVPILLIINGFVMIVREGKSLANLLSLLFGIFILGGEMVLLWGIRMTGSDSTLLHVILIMLGYAVFYASMVFLAFLFYTWTIKLIPRRSNFNYVIVLGAGLINGETVSKLLSDRLDKGIKVYERSLSDCKIICSGGQGPDEKVSEEEAMKRYLLSQGIDEKDILKEDRSTDTMENLTNCKEIINSRKGNHYTAIVTSGYHVLRAMIYSRRIDFEATGIGAHTAFYYWPSAMIREYAALVKYYYAPYFIGLFVTEFLLFELLYRNIAH